MEDLALGKAICVTCGKNIDVAQSRVVSAVSGKNKYECFGCYRTSKNSLMAPPPSKAQKLNLYCARCKYKFKSRDLLCPYCSQGDLVVRSDISVGDLL